MQARSLMVLGTASHVGKSILAAALCRIFARSGIRVAPFKAQNMSLNSAATIDGFEIGRAQALQAEAAGLFATRDMNPILLKPDSNRSCQIIVQGRVWKNLSAGEYNLNRVKELFPIVLESYHRLAGQYDLVILEGAGSPAEINLKETDIVNMRMAAAADAACLLVADIDRGGVFASLVGTLELLTADERDRVRGFAINKFRGDLSLLTPGIVEVEKKLRKPCVGVVPYLRDLGLDEEDSVGLESRHRTSAPLESWVEQEDKARSLRIAVVQLPYLSNFTDFDALASEPTVSLQFVQKPQQVEQADVIILPGTKQTSPDLQWLRDSGFAEAIAALSSGKLIVGICGGMQMMGRTLSDPHLMEGGGQTSGLGLLPIDTTMLQEKITAQVTASLISDQLFGIHHAERCTSGYEIHLGETAYIAGSKPVFELRRCHAPEVAIADGAQSADGRIWGTYVHGLFDNDAFRHAFLRTARIACNLHASGNFAFRAAERQRKIDDLADSVESSLAMSAIREWIGLPATNATNNIVVTAS
jgi:adenosylcobyric acid synthase